ncbi:MAG: cytochrome c biogenesis protein CcdA [Archaeoglobus sp.]|nr:cytochrome c biogenesis protein CcdA [Archaeoglobus sp.]
MIGFLGYLISFAGGVLSVFSPCILPVLPVILATAEGKWWRSILVVIGLVFSFGVLGLVFGILGSIKIVSYIAFVVLFIFGIMLVFDLQVSQFDILSGFFGRKMVKASTSSFYPFVLGMSLGVIWSPCIGPILGAVIGLVAVSGSALGGTLLMLSYAFGMAVAISAILIAGSRFSGKLIENQTTINRIFGAVILTFLFLMLSGILDFLEILLIQRLEGFEEWVRGFLSV